MHATVHTVVAGLLFGCASSYQSDVPSCLAEARTAPAECVNSPAVAEFEAALSEILLRRLRAQYPEGLPLRVSLDASSAVDSLCLGDATSAPDWSLRSRVARALPDLRASGPGPACLADSVLDLAPTLAQREPGQRGSRFSRGGLISCAGLRNDMCLEQHAPVCGVSPDGTRRTYPNACDACSSSFVQGYLSGPC